MESYPGVFEITPEDVKIVRINVFELGNGYLDVWLGLLSVGDFLDMAISLFEMSLITIVNSWSIY